MLFADQFGNGLQLEYPYNALIKISELGIIVL